MGFFIFAAIKKSNLSNFCPVATKFGTAIVYVTISNSEPQKNWKLNLSFFFLNTSIFAE